MAATPPDPGGQGGSGPPHDGNPWKVVVDKKLVGVNPLVATTYFPLPADSGKKKQPLLAFQSKNKFDLLEDNADYVRLVEKARALDDDDDDDDISRLPIDQEDSVVPIQDLPEKLKYTEPNADILYPEYLPCDERKNVPMSSVFEYRGVDRATFKSGKDRMGKSEHCFIQFLDKDAVQTHGGTPIYGWPQTAKTETEKRSKCVKNNWATDSQYPSISFSVNRDPTITDQALAQEPATMIVFGNSIRSKPSNLGLTFTAPGDPKLPEFAPKDHEVLQALIKSGCWKIKVRLNPRVGTKSGKDPVWTGIAHDEFVGINRQFDEDASQLSHSQKLIAGLSRTTEFIIWRQADPKDNETLKSFVAYMRACLFGSARYGNFWWYSLGSDVPIHSSSYVFADGYNYRQPPRWLTKTARVTTYSGDAKKMSYKPEEWDTFVPIESGLYPDADTVAFAHRLGMAREVQRQDDELDRLCAQSQGRITCTIRAFGDTGSYLADITVAKIYKIRPETIMPELKRRVTLHLTYKGFDVKLNGHVCEDAFLSKSHMSVICSTRDSNPPQFENDNEVHNVTLDFLRDVKSNHRAMNAVSSLQDGHERTVGVQFTNVCFGAPIPDDRREDADIKPVPDDDQAKFVRLLRRTGLNASQHKACTQAQSPSGSFFLIWGPPGTGKTHATQTLVQALAAVGRKVIVTATTISAVASAAQKFDDLNDSSTGIGHDEWCIFKGAFHNVDFKGEKAVAFTGYTSEMEIDSADGAEDKDVDTEMSDVPKKSWADQKEEEEAEEAAKRKKELEERLYTMVMSHTKALHGTDDGKSHLFPDKKVAWVQAIRDSPFDEDQTLSEDEQLMRQKALEYSEALWGMQSSAKPKPTAASRKAFLELDQWWTQRYLEQKVKVVFVSNNSSCHESLTEYFKPTFLLSDEAGQSTPADAMTPMAAFKESLEAVALCGDHKQLRPTVLSKGRNETYSWVEMSLYEAAKKNKVNPVPCEMFKQQYRMAPEISDFPNRYIYEGEIEDAASVKVDTDNRKRFRTMMSKTGDRWNGSLRIAFNVQGPSGKFVGTDSACNLREAHFVVRLALQSIAHGIPPDEIAIITPYSGQQRLINQILLGSTAYPTIEVKSTNESQGREKSCVILSFVRNDPEDPSVLGFIYHKWLLCVGITRSKDSLCLVGNFGGWISEILAETKQSFFSQSDVKTFAAFCKDVWDKKGVISEDDFVDSLNGKTLPKEIAFYHNMRPRAPRPRVRSAKAGGGKFDQAPGGMAPGAGSRRPGIASSNQGGQELGLFVKYDNSSRGGGRGAPRGNRGGGRGGRGGRGDRGGGRVGRGRGS